MVRRQNYIARTPSLTLRSFHNQIIFFELFLEFCGIFGKMLYVNLAVIWEKQHNICNLQPLHCWVQKTIEKLETIQSAMNSFEFKLQSYFDGLAFTML